MTFRTPETVSHLFDTALEPRRTPVSLYLLVTMLAMNVSATVLSLMV